MARLEEITVGTSVKGVLPDGLVTAVAVVETRGLARRGDFERWFTVAVKQVAAEFARRIAILQIDRDAADPAGDGSLFHLMSEAHRVPLACLFDPLLIVNTSLLEPVRHQVTSVGGEICFARHSELCCRTILPPSGWISQEQYNV